MVVPTPSFGFSLIQSPLCLGDALGVCGHDGIAPEVTLQRAAQLMVEHALAHLVVVRGKHPVGVISTLDIAAAIAGRAGA